MKKRLSIFWLSVFVGCSAQDYDTEPRGQIMIVGAGQSQGGLAEVKGTYLGQTPPGRVRSVFAPGILSNEHRDLSGFFNSEMTEFYFTRKHAVTEKWTLHVFKLENDGWHQSTVMPRIGRPFISPDGKTMHLGSHYMERNKDGWTDVKSLGPMFDREDWGIMRLSASNEGTYVFDDYKGGDVIRMSRLKNGYREKPIVLGEEVNTGRLNAHPFIAPDDSYMIWDGERETGYGSSDLYISFRQKDGSWGDAVNMGDGINSENWEGSATVTPDGKYIFFNGTISPGKFGMYWMGAQIIESLRRIQKNED